MQPNAPADNTGSSPGTVTNDNVVADAIANAAAGSRVSLADQADALYEEKVKETPKDEPAEPKEKPEAKEAPKETAPSKDEPEVPAEAGKGADEPTGYFADEGLDEPETPAPTRQPDAPANPATMTFTPEEKYIADNIGAPINVRIKIGDEIKTVQAYSVDNLPDSFEFASEKDRTQAQLGFDAIIRKAENLQQKYQTEQQQQQAQDYEVKENRDIQRDIAFLQRQKVAGNDGLDLFKYQANDPRFENDPAVKEMQDVLDFYNKENQARFESSQRNGSLYHRLSFRDAFKLYRTENPKVGPAQQKEDEERKEITKGLAKAGRSKGDAPKQQRPKLPRSADVDMIARAYGL